MAGLISSPITNFMPCLIEAVKAKQEKIFSWLESYEEQKELPLYSSVDIRDAGFKIAVVDTNLFPAGFNNLCEHGLEDAVDAIKGAVYRRSNKAKDVLIIAEEHTRNTWYLENIRILEEIIRKAGFDVKTATFLTLQPEFCDNNINFIELETATGAKVNIHCLKKIKEDFESGKGNIDLIILNNDLTTGVPDILASSKIPIYPSIKAGWHSRLKSLHFKYTDEIMKEFADIINVDPWFFSCLYEISDNININVDEDRVRLSETAEKLFKRISKKYKEYNINEKPYLVVKADSGTYGMGILPIEDPKDILTLNRKNKNKLYKGKSSKVVERYLLQEGVETKYSIGQNISETVIYQIENNLIGGFYRTHSGKSPRDNLNSQGMNFQKMCPHSTKYGDCGVHHDVNVFDIYRILARIAAIAAHREIEDLEKQQ